MISFKSKQMLKKKSILLSFFIMCGLLISEKTLAVYDKKYYRVSDYSINGEMVNYINIFFIFFEYEKIHGVKNSYLKKIDVEYYTRNALKFKRLMSASTKNQTLKDKTWLKFNNKKATEKIELFMSPPHPPTNEPSSTWEDGTNPKLEVVAIDSLISNQAWCGVRWYPPVEELYNVTQIRIIAKWYCHVKKKIEKVRCLHFLLQKRPKLISNSLNCSNSAPHEEIKIEAKDNTVKAYKEANAIVVEGALNDNILVYTTTGALIKSMLAESDVLQIPLPANQLYIVNVGQVSYKLAL